MDKGINWLKYLDKELHVFSYFVHYPTVRNRPKEHEEEVLKLCSILL